MRTASRLAPNPASLSSWERPASLAASNPKKMSKSFARGRHTSRSSVWREMRSVRVCTKIQRLDTPRLRSASASSRLRLQVLDDVDRYLEFSLAGEAEVPRVTFVVGLV